MRSEDQMNGVIERYADMVRRICMTHVKSYADTEDIFQKVFVSYALYDGEFEGTEHEKAWLIRVTVNACRDLYRDFFRRHTVPLDQVAEQAVEMTETDREVWEAVLSLPAKYRDVVYLHYYEGYTAPQIGQLLEKNVNTVYTLLNRSKKLLREKLGGDKL